MSGPLARAAGLATASGAGVAVALTDLLPPRVRYGYVHRLTRAALRPALPAVASDVPVVEGQCGAPVAPGGTDLTCVLATDALDVGGVGSVVEMLGTGLATQAVRPVVVCTDDGVRAARLRAGGVEVRVVHDPGSARQALRAIGPAAIQLHSAPAYLEDAAVAEGVPLVPVLHNTEIHFTRERWAAFTRLAAQASACVAVSETVRAFHERRLPADVGARLVVIPNGAPGRLGPRDPQDRVRARGVLARTLDVDLGDDVVFVCLARYDSQKNIAGLVASFLRAVPRGPRLRLVVAGEPSDPMELMRADGLRRASRFGSRVHLLANSDPATLLAAADAFVLDSFFEGWPVAATEAAAAGLPLLLSEAGGARELVARDPDRSRMVANPCGDAGAVSDARVRRARRSVRRQVNARELADAFVAMGATACGVASPPATFDGLHEMLVAHGSLIHSVAGPVRGSAPSPAGSTRRT